jgi:hypothetical protein
MNEGNWGGKRSEARSWTHNSTVAEADQMNVMAFRHRAAGLGVGIASEAMTNLLVKGLNKRRMFNLSIYEEPFCRGLGRDLVQQSRYPHALADVSGDLIYISINR